MLHMTDTTDTIYHSRGFRPRSRTERRPALTGKRAKTILLAALTMAVAMPAAARAEDKLGGHIGTVFAPLVSSEKDGRIFDHFAIGFPMGITIKRPDNWAFDLEFVPSVSHNPLSVGLTVHPGILRGLSNHYTAGLRAAFDVGAASWGFTPLINKAFPVDDHMFFIEGVLPIRFTQDAAGNNHSSIGLGVHLGVGF